MDFGACGAAGPDLSGSWRRSPARGIPVLIEPEWLRIVIQLPRFPSRQMIPSGSKSLQRLYKRMTCHDHAHREHSGTSLIGAARSALTAAGEQWTGMREAVFAELARHERPASAYDIADNLSRSRGRRVAPNSVYRILDLFVTNNLAPRASGRAHP